MKYIAYCVVHDDGLARSTRAKGIDGGPIILVAHGGLAAACSQVRHPTTTPDTHRAMAYARVVEAVHRTRTALPMRYGCLFETQKHITQFLRQHAAGLRTLLEEVDECEEMGIRALLRGPAQPNAAGSHVGPRPFGMRRDAPTQAAKSTPGADYLANRQTIYASGDLGSREASLVTDAILHSLDGLFLKFQRECAPSHHKALLSLHFLIRRKHIGAFRQAFQRFQAQTDRSLLLTGPWPPYTFVSLDGA